MSRRRRPLHTCGVSICAVGSKVHTRIQDLDGPVGSVMKRMSSSAAAALLPIVRAMQCQWLAVLSFADDHILAVEKLIETLFPPSARLFDKIDEFVHTAETVPAKFDEAVSKFPLLIHRVPVLDWAFTCLIAWLNFLIYALTHWRLDYTREKEIKVDTNSNNLKEEEEDHRPSESTADAHSADKKKRQPRKSDSCKDVRKRSYKEMLEKGMKESAEEEEDGILEESSSAFTRKQNEGEFIEGLGNEHPLLQLFDTSWHMKPVKVSNGNVMFRSASYT
ncbi:uncharacterized protein LOC127797869 isoform X2 [Diospyros lotus]|nr:uncharacterized protein LOC127797869 isoform X2 [Diospyros lotus]